VLITGRRRDRTACATGCATPGITASDRYQPVQNLTNNEEAIVADVANRSAIEAMIGRPRVVHLAGVLAITTWRHCSV